MADYFQTSDVPEQVTRRTVSLRKSMKEEFGVELFAIGYQTLVGHVKKYVVVDVNSQQTKISCAFKIGLKFGDRLTTINGKPVVCVPDCAATVRAWVDTLNNAEKVILEIDNQPFFKNSFMILKDILSESLGESPPQSFTNGSHRAVNSVPSISTGSFFFTVANQSSYHPSQHSPLGSNRNYRRQGKHTQSDTSLKTKYGEENSIFTMALKAIGVVCKDGGVISRVVTNSVAHTQGLVVGNVILQLNDASTVGLTSDQFDHLLEHCLTQKRIHIVHAHATVARELLKGLQTMMKFLGHYDHVNEYINTTLVLDSYHPQNLSLCDDPEVARVVTIEHDVSKLEYKLKKVHSKHGKANARKLQQNPQTYGNERTVRGGIQSAPTTPRVSQTNLSSGRNSRSEITHSSSHSFNASPQNQPTHSSKDFQIASVRNEEGGSSDGEHTLLAMRCKASTPEQATWHSRALGILRIGELNRWLKRLTTTTEQSTSKINGSEAD
eukprot:CFRG1331T1